MSGPNQSRPWKTALDSITTLAMLAAAVVLIATSLPDRNIQPTLGPSAEPPLPTTPITLDGAATKGNRAARVLLLEFTDFQCPYCDRFTKDTLPTLMARYVDTGRVLFALRHRPLVTIHPNAKKAAEATVCAGRQGKTWDMHDMLFRTSNLNNLNSAALHTMAAMLSLDGEQFAKCLAGEATAQVDLDLAIGDALLLRGTPGFFVGRVQPSGHYLITRIIRGARPLADFMNALDDAIAESQ